jgi:ribonuclease HI
VEIELWTDGSSTGAVGDGGWAFVLRCGEKVKEGSGYVPDTTNNRMEMTALLMGLRALTREGVFVRVFTDSEYLMKPFTHGWLHKWERGGWITGRGSKKKPVANQDLWQALKEEAGKHRVTFEWVRGHAGTLLNERCDELAKAAKVAGMSAHVEIELPGGASLELEFAS